MNDGRFCWGLQGYPPHPPAWVGDLFCTGSAVLASLTGEKWSATNQMRDGQRVSACSAEF